MKKYFFLLVFLNFTSSYSQEYPVKQLFNLSGNVKNPTFFFNADYFVENYKNGNNLSFELEKDSSTDIYISHFDPQKDSFTTPVPLLINGGFNINSSGKIYQEFSAIIFQTNINGNWDIGYKEFKNGQWNDEIIISDSTGDEVSPSFINYPIFSSKDSLLKILFVKDNSVYLFTKTFAENQFELIFQGTDSIKFSQPTGIFTTIWTGNTNVEGYRIAAKMNENNIPKIISIFLPLDEQADTNIVLIDSGEVNNPKFKQTAEYSQLSLTYEKGDNIYLENAYGLSSNMFLPLRDKVTGRIYNLSSIILARPVFKTLFKKNDFYLQFPYTFVNYHNDSTFIFLEQDYFHHDVFIYTRIKDNYPAAGIAGFNTKKYMEIDYILWTDSARGNIQLYGKRYDYILGGVDDEINPKIFFLYQNYPNPFNPSTKIKFVIPKTSFVTLKIYDVLGREVATLINEEKFTGEYIIQFNAENLSSGIYFYQIKAGIFVQSKKMIILR